LTAGNESSFKTIGASLSTRYLLTGVVDEIMWRPTTWSNRYTFVVSAQIIDLQTGKVEAQSGSPDNRQGTNGLPTKAVERNILKMKWCPKLPDNW
jgi:hypothetical protein